MNKHNFIWTNCHEVEMKVIMISLIVGGKRGAYFVYYTLFAQF